MRIFYMFGRFMQNGKWKTEEELPDFAGCMMQKDNSGEIFGYQSELYSLDTKEVKKMSKPQMCAVEAAGGGGRIRFIRGFYNGTTLCGSLFSIFIIVYIFLYVNYL